MYCCSATIISLQEVCYQYWPADNTKGVQKYGEFTVSVLKATQQEDGFIKRNISITNPKVIVWGKFESELECTNWCITYCMVFELQTTSGIFLKRVSFNNFRVDWKLKLTFDWQRTWKWSAYHCSNHVNMTWSASTLSQKQVGELYDIFPALGQQL